MKRTISMYLPKYIAAIIFVGFVGCATTGSNFDESKVSEIKKGQTTEADLTRMFGPPENRSTNSEGTTTLSWMYYETTTKGASFIPIAGMFLGGSKTKGKTLSVHLGTDGKVMSFQSSGGGSEARPTTENAPISK